MAGPVDSSAPTTAIDVPGNSPELRAVTFTTPRLYCRRVGVSDAEDIFLIRSNPNIANFSTYPPDPDVSATLKDMERRASQPKNYSFAITLRTPEPAPAPKLIGVIGGTTLPELGYGMNESYWGKGYATEALEGYIKMYWEQFPQGYPGIEEEAERHVLRATVDKGNPASMKVLANAGFKQVGEIEVDDFKAHGKIKLDAWEIKRPGVAGHGGKAAA